MNYLNVVVLVTALLLVLGILVINLMSLYTRDKNLSKPVEEKVQPLLGVVHPK